MAKKDYYKILNIPHKASLKEIKAAYRQMALKYHPDHNPDNPTALQMFAQVKEAYELLTTPDLRKKYDVGYSPSSSGPSRAQAEPETHHKTTSTSQKVNKGKNLRYNLFITLEEVVSGCERGIRYIRNNNGENETVQLKVRVPKGAFHHQRLKLVQYGDVTKDSIGDLFVVIHLQNHPLFLKNNDNIRVNVPISYLDAALGNTIEVPTLNGIRKLKLKNCEFDDLQYIMKGFGLPDPKGNYKGDLIVYCFIEHPKRLSTNERSTMEKVSRTWPQGEMMQQYQLYLKQLKEK